MTKTKTKKKRAGVLARVSTAEQVAEGYSMGAQVERGRLYCDLHQWDLVDVYEDGGVSGALGIEDRPEGARFIRDARRGLVDVAIFTKLDRFSRSTKQALNDFDLLDDLGVEIVFIEDNLDTTTPMGRAMRDLMLAFATLERETIRDRNMQGRYMKASLGAGWATGRVPFGFEVGDDGQLVINEHEADAIRLAFRLRAQGKPYREVASALNGEGFQPRAKVGSNGEPLPLQFTSGSISHYIKADYYKGDPIIRRLAPNDQAKAEAFEFPVPALITEKQWERANTISKGSSDRGGKGHRAYGLGGRIWHEHADGQQSTMYGHARRTGNGAKGDYVRFYRCQASRNTHLRPQDENAMLCDGFGILQAREAVAIQADWVEARVLLFMLDKLSKPEELEALLDEADAAILGDSLEEDPDELRIQIAKLLVKSERWAEQYAEGIVSKPKRDERIEAINVERAALEVALAKIQAADAQRKRTNTVAEILTDGGRPPVDRDVENYEDLLNFTKSHGQRPPPRGTSIWWQALRAIASATINEPGQWGRFPALPTWVVKEVRALADDLDVHVILERSDDPRRPNVKVVLAPVVAAGKAFQGTATSRGTSAYIGKEWNETPASLEWVSHNI